MSAQPVVIRSDSVTLTAQGQVVATRLRNEDSVGVEINRLQFSSPGLAWAYTNAFMIRLTYHVEPITNGWIPLYAMCSPQSILGEVPYPGPSIKLEKPVYLAPGEWIDVSFGTFPGGALNVPVRVAGYGMQVASAPPEFWIPYCAHYLGGQRNASTDGGTFTDTSQPQDLGNPFDTPLRISRLTGRVIDNVGGVVPAAYWSFFTLSLSDDAGNLWISANTSIPAIFNPSNYAWPVNTTMAPKGYLRAQIEGVTIPSIVVVNTNAPLLGLVGYRSIPN